MKNKKISGISVIKKEVEEEKGNLLLQTMFLKSLLEDYSFEDVKESFEEDRFFEYVRKSYQLTEVDEEVFNQLKASTVDMKRTSLEVLTLKKEGFYPRVFLEDHEEELLTLKEIKTSDIVGYPVDMDQSNNVRKSLLLITVLLLERTYYVNVEKMQ